MSVNFDAIPEVRVTVDRMKHTMISHLADYEGKVTDAIRERLTDALSGPAMQQAISEAVDREIRVTVATITSQVVGAALRESKWIERAVQIEVDRALRVMESKS